VNRGTLLVVNVVFPGTLDVRVVGGTTGVVEELGDPVGEGAIGVVVVLLEPASQAAESKLVNGRTLEEMGRREIYLVEQNNMLDLRWERYGRHLLVPRRLRWGLEMWL
jgi:hypothetical protein